MCLGKNIPTRLKTNKLLVILLISSSLNIDEFKGTLFKILDPCKLFFSVNPLVIRMGFLQCESSCDTPAVLAGLV